MGDQLAVQEALRLLRARDQRGQGRAETPETGPATADRLAAMEAHAVSVRAWNPQVVPGLLQTVQYAAGAIKTGLPGLPLEEVERRAVQRARRVQAFYERWAQHVETVGFAWFIIGESAIRRPLISPYAHAGQLHRLLALSEFPRVRIQVLPDGVPTSGRAGQFTVYGLEPGGSAPVPGGELPGTRVGYLETPVGAWYTTRVQDTARLYSGFSDMVGAAYDPAESRECIREELECWAPMAEPGS